MSQGARELTVVCCGAPPASNVGELIQLAQHRSWSVRVVPTPAARSFVHVAMLEAMTGNKVEAGYRSPSDPRPPRPDAVIVAPATFNSIIKSALGITDTHALGVIAEAIGRPIPVVMLPWVNGPLAARQPFRRSVAQLRNEDVHFLLKGEHPTEPFGVENSEVGEFPWVSALDVAEHYATF
jgi:phosphopantothenoylcysteine synthetase/decarboxylase